VLRVRDELSDSLALIDRIPSIEHEEKQPIRI
jgi:hypothetical protein